MRGLVSWSITILLIVHLALTSATTSPSPDYDEPSSTTEDFSITTTEYQTTTEFQTTTDLETTTEDATTTEYETTTEVETTTDIEIETTTDSELESTTDWEATTNFENSTEFDTTTEFETNETTTKPDWPDDEADCDPPAIENFPSPLLPHSIRENGGFVIYMVLAIFGFVGLFILCRDYFMPSLDKICEG